MADRDHQPVVIVVAKVPQEHQPKVFGIAVLVHAVRGRTAPMAKKSSGPSNPGS
jgi:hypothetical protein